MGDLDGDILRHLEAAAQYLKQWDNNNALYQIAVATGRADERKLPELGTLIDIAVLLIDGEAIYASQMIEELLDD